MTQDKIQIDEQLAEKYKEKWKAISVDTKETDKALASKAINEIYEAKGLPAPYILFVENPIHGVRIAEYAMQKESAGNLKRVLDWVATEEFKTKKATKVDFHGYGQLDAYWLVYWDYLIDNHREVVEKDIPVIKPTMDLSLQANYYWLLDLMAIVTVKPKVFAVENDKFHNLFEPAIKFNDFEVYCLNGEVVNQEEWAKKTAPYKSTVAKTVFQKL